MAKGIVNLLRNIKSKGQRVTNKQLLSSQAKMEKVNIPPDFNVTIFIHSPQSAHLEAGVLLWRPF